MSDRLLRIGLAGTLVVAICCFTPALVWIFGALGASAVIGYLDLAFLPLLGVFLFITGVALWRRRKAK